MNQNSNSRCSCFCRPQIPAPPCINTDCRCDCQNRCDICDGTFIPSPPPMPPAAPARPPLPPVRPAAPPQNSSNAPAPRPVKKPDKQPAFTPLPAHTSTPSGGCGCGSTSSPLIPNKNGNNMPVGMAYVPWQKWGQTYSMEQGFSRGTLFPDLDLPFVMGRCR